MSHHSIKTYTHLIFVLLPCSAYAPKISPWPKMAAPTPAIWCYIPECRKGAKRGSISPFSGTLLRSCTYHFCSRQIHQLEFGMPHRISRDLGKCLKSRQSPLLEKKWKNGYCGTTGSVLPQYPSRSVTALIIPRPSQGQGPGKGRFSGKV